MPKYKYKALKKDGSDFSGVITANSKNEIIEYLKSKEYFPSYIEEVRDSSSLNINIRSHPNSKHIAVFCKKLSAMMKAGLPIINSIEILMNHTSNKMLKESIFTIYEDLQKGLTFSESLNKHPTIYPELLIHMVESAELSGTLDEVLEKLALHYDKETKNKNKIKNALVYPIILSLAAIVMIIFMLVFVFPTFVDLFESSNTQLPLPTQIIIVFSNSLTKYWYIHIVVLSILTFGINKFLKSKDGKIFLHRLKFKIPVLRNLNQMIITTRFTRTISSLLYSGVPLLQAIESTSKVIGNVVIEEKLLAIRDEVRKGSELSVPIKFSGMFPPMVDNMIKIGENSGTLDEILEKTADYFEDELDAAITQLTAMFEPLLIIFMGGILGFIVVAMALPLFDIMKTVN